MRLSILIMVLALLGDQAAPYLDFSRAGAGFYGPGRELSEPAGLKSVKIGVLGPGKSPEGLQQRMAVQIAIDEANARGGYCPPSVISHADQNRAGTEHSPESASTSQAIPYELVFRPDDGAWGVTANQVVQFAYEDQVWAIIGGLDGHHTHIAELVVAKAWVPVISPAAIDSTVEYANVPWVFRVAPSDTLQAEALLNYARKQGYARLAVLAESQREAYSGIQRLKECSGKMRFPLARHLEYSAQNPEEIVPRLGEVEADAFVIWGRPSSAVSLLTAMRRAGIAQPVLAPATMATPEVAGKAPRFGDLTVAAPCDLSFDRADIQTFLRAFEQRAGHPASWIAIYSYDVARLVIQSIVTGGLNRARIRDAMSQANFSGLAGLLSFNSLGGRDAQPFLMSLKNGRWIRLE